MKKIIKNTMKALAIMMLFIFINQACDAQAKFNDYEAWFNDNSVTTQSYVPNNLIVVTKTPVLWNQKLQSVEEFTGVFPAGSKITACADVCLHDQNREFALAGKYFGTQFLVVLPSSNANELLKNDSEAILAKASIIKTIALNNIGKLTSSAPIPFSDPSFSVVQNHLYYNPAAIAGGVKYSGWQHCAGWKLKNTQPVIVASIDGGANFSHQDFQNSYWVNTLEALGVNGVDDDGNGYPDDSIGYDFYYGDNDPFDNTASQHGMNVNGILAARVNNGFNIVGGIRDQSSLIVLKNSDVSGNSTEFATTSAYNYAVSKGAKIINMSFIFNACPTLMSTIQTNVALGVVPVAGTGNTGLNENFYPSSGANVLSIGSSNWAGVHSGFSTYNDSVDFLFPGAGITSLSAINNTGTSYLSGTSQATPGLLATFVWPLKKLFPNDGVQAIKQKIIEMTGGSWNITDGYGEPTRLDLYYKKIALTDTAITFTACTGIQQLPQIQHFAATDSSYFGHLAVISTGQVNMNLIPPGVYTLPVALGFNHGAQGWFRDTVYYKLTVLPGAGVGTPTININATPAGAVCVGTSVTFNSTITNGGATPFYQWKKDGVNVGGNSPTYTYVPANGDQISCVLTSNAPCLAANVATSNTITMVVNALPNVTASVSPAATVCAGTAVTLTGNNANTYSWTGGVTNGLAFTPAGTSTYTVTGTDMNTCSNTTTITVTVNTVPNVSITANPLNASVCPGGSVTLSGNGAASYSWSGGITNGVSFTPAATTTYTVTGTTGICSSTATQLVTVHSLPNITASVSPNDTVCSGDAITLNGNAGVSYSWSGGITNGVAFTPAANITYTVTGTDANTCSNTATMSIVVNANTVPTGTLSVSKAIDANNHTIATYTLTTGVGIDHIDWYLSGVFQTQTAVNVWIHQIPDNTSDTAYAVLFATGGCYNPDTVITNTITTAGTVTGLADLVVPEGFQLYPNPSSSDIYMAGMKKGDQLKIFDAVGKIVSSTTFDGLAVEKIEMNDLAAGLYVAYFSRQGKQWVVKVLKQ